MSDTLHFGWFIPTNGDSRTLGDPTGMIPPSMDLFTRIARAAEDATLEYILVPVQTYCWDAYMVCAMVAAKTERIKPLLAARCGFIAPTVMAKMLSTLDQLTDGRVLVNLIAGGSAAELAADGSFYDHDERYEVMDETVTIMKRVWTETEPVDFDGKFFKVEGAKCVPRPYQHPYPAFYLGGSSDAAKNVSAKHASVHLFWGDTPENIAKQLDDVRARAKAAGRLDELRFGMRLQIIVRETEEEAWDEARRLIADARPEFQKVIQNMWEDSEANTRMKELSKAKDYRLGPHLWSGLTIVRPGAGVAIVGNPEQVINQLEEFIEIGCTDFCLSGYLHDEEATRVGELILPHFADRRASEFVGV
jgi:alkanesulfonate monooxygenase